MKRLMMVVAVAGALMASGLVAAHGSEPAAVDAEWDCEGIVTVSSTRHAISNIVIRDTDGDTKVLEPFEEVEVFEYQFASTEGLEGVFVKAGNNGTRGKANQGYGDWVPLTAPEDCGPVLGTGDIQVTLRWEGSATQRDDYDLYVIDPLGDTVSFARRTVPSGGTLDFDAICLPGESVENVFWPESSAPAGQYTVGVDLFSSCLGFPGEAQWHLVVKVAGVVVIDATGVGDSNPVQRVAGPENTFTFTYPTP